MSLNKFTIQKSFAISAGAGSGKTYTLSRRYINALLGFDYFRECYEVNIEKGCLEKHESFFEKRRSAKVREIVTITYTEAAALEMKGRIFELVSKIIDQNLDSEDDDFESIQEANAELSDEEKVYVKETLMQAFRDSSNAKISTIHAYCLDIIKANADIAKIDTKLDIIKDDEKAKVLSDIIFEVLNDEKNKNMVLDISKDISMFFINGLIDKYVSSSKFRKDYDSFERDSIDITTYKELIYELYPLPNIGDALEELQEDTVRVKWFKDFYENFVNFDAVAWKEVDESTKAPSMGEKKFPIADPIKKELEKILKTASYSEINTNKETLFFDKIDKIKGLLHQIKSRYDAKLDELGKIDFDTIITKTLDIIGDVKTNFKYIMVDEFQDTNETQFSIIEESAKHTNANLFVVGDSKQSIYSFQGAEIEVFNNAVQDKDLFSSIEDMSINHRSDGVVLNTVNSIFKPLLQKNENLKIISQNYEAEAQDLKPKKGNKGKGSFKYLITSQPYQSKAEKEGNPDEIDEMDIIAQFVYELCYYQQPEYKQISDLIANKERAIAILFDGGEKMLQLKVKLREKGITAKISKSDNFYHTKEINDIFNVLKAIDILSKKSDTLDKRQKYYVAGAMRSNILRVDDNSIKKYLETNSVSENLKNYVEVFPGKTLSQMVKYIYDSSNVMGVYAHFNDVEQRVANLYKFLTLCQEFEQGREINLHHFLSLIENAIYFSEAKEDEAFFKSDNTKSIELCTIHSTKGLAYPLVLMGNADKGLYSQITSDPLKHNNFRMNGEKKEIVGFKINNYIPLSHRVLKQIDKMKHLAEKKRLLYVALTRAEHDVVISANLKQTKPNKEGKSTISLQEDSYLHMICESLEIDKNELYGQNERYCITLEDRHDEVTQKDEVKYVEYALKPIEFKSNCLISATSDSETTSPDNTAANLGTIVHRIIELYWNSFNKNQDAILDKMMIFETLQRASILKHMKAFYNSDIYELLENGVEHRFELEFNVDGKTGFIDFVYFDIEKNGWVIVDFKTGVETEEKNKKYQKQLEFYSDAIKKYKVVDTRLLWI